MTDWLDIQRMIAPAGPTIGAAFDLAPGLVVAAALALAIPVLALLGGLVLLAGRLHRRLRRRTAARLRQATQPAPGSGDAGGIGGHPIVRIDGGWPIAVARDKSLTVIGRDGGCDIRLTDASVADHHLAIERTVDDEVWIIDLTGPAGAGIKVDHRRVANQRLRGGELIEVGAVRVMFEVVGGPR